jgi:hypothetical protein
MSVLRGFSILAFMVVSGVAQAATFYSTSTIKSFTLMSSANASYEDAFTLNGFTSAGTCLVENGYVVVRVRDDERGKKQISLLMAAKLANKEVTIRVREDRVDAYGSCYLDVLTIE